MVFRKNSFQEAQDTCKPLKTDEKIPIHALKCYAQLAVSRTFSDIVRTFWQDHAWYFGADWIVKRWIQSGFTQEDTDVSQNSTKVQQSGDQEEHLMVELQEVQGGYDRMKQCKEPSALHS